MPVGCVYFGLSQRSRLLFTDDILLHALFRDLLLTGLYLSHL